MKTAKDVLILICLSIWILAGISELAIRLAPAIILQTQSAQIIQNQGQAIQQIGQQLQQLQKGQEVSE